MQVVAVLQKKKVIGAVGFRITIKGLDIMVWFPGCWRVGTGRVEFRAL